MDERRLVTSRYLVILDVEPGWSFVGHAVLGNRRIYDREAADLVRLFEQPRTVREAVALALRRGLVPPWAAAAAHSPELLAQQLEGFVAELCEAHLLVPDGLDEQAWAAARIRRTWGRDVDQAFGIDSVEDLYQPVLAARLAERMGPGAAAQERVSFLLLGWCFTQTVRPVLEHEARQRGLRATVHVGFQGDVHLIEELEPTVTVLQLSHRLLLAPVLDQFHRRPAEELEERIELACGAIRAAVAGALERVGEGRLLLVQGIARPQTSPLGALDVRHPIGFFEAVARLDRAARDAVAAAGNALFVDEEALLSSHGKRFLLDDLVSTYSHHGVLAFEPGSELEAEEAASGPDRLASFGVRDRTLLHRLLAGAYLDLYELWRGRGAIRCIAVDLDGTLWPGLIGDEAWRLDADGLVVPMMYGRYGGLHEALKIVRDRGILLAAVSKNSPGTVLEKWRLEDVPLGLGVQREDTWHYLAPEDFVLLKIGWDKKSEQIRQLAAELGLALEQIAFVDDHPVEREEVRQALPEVLVLGDDMNRVREVLLSSPRFAVLGPPSEEARRRTETTRARLQRDAARSAAGDHAAFLRSLEVRCTLRRERDASRVRRIAELLARTNQFNTTARRPGPAELERLIAAPDADVLTMEVEDRFSSYGLVGVALLEGRELACFALSCRVLGLEAEFVLLRAALACCRERHEEGIVPFVPTERNLPATRLFHFPGLEPLEDGSGYRIDFRRTELPPAPAHCTVSEA